jgi:hypothetical protein
MAIDFNNPGQQPVAPNAITGNNVDPFVAMQQPQQQTAQFVPQQQGAVQGSQAMPEYVDTDAMDGGFSELPVGSYQARLATVTPGVSKATQAQMVTVEFEIVAGNYKGQTTRKWYVTAPKWDAKKNEWNSRGIAQARNDMRALGINPPKKFPTNARDAAQIIGTALQQAGVFTIVLTKSSYQEKDRVTGNALLNADGSPKMKEAVNTKLVAAGGGAQAGPVGGGTNPFGL